jgi:hypothetical protein
MTRDRPCLLAVLALSLSSAGCAVQKPSLSVERYGEVGLTASEVSALEATATSESPDDVRVIRGKLPDGLARTRDDTLVVAQGYEQTYEILGVVRAYFVWPHTDALPVEGERTRPLIECLKRGAKALGGNLVVFTPNSLRVRPANVLVPDVLFPGSFHEEQGNVSLPKGAINGSFSFSPYAPRNMSLTGFVIRVRP